MERKRRSLHEMQRLMRQVTGTTDFSGFKTVDVVVEAVFEDLELKRRVLAELEATAGDDAILATNTSSLPIAQIAPAIRACLAGTMESHEVLLSALNRRGRVIACKTTVTPLVARGAEKPRGVIVLMDEQATVSPAGDGDGDGAVRRGGERAAES